MKRILLLATLGLFMVGCTEQEMVKNFGGTATRDLPPGKKLVLITWKEANMWILTRDRKANEVPETYEFAEESSYGVFQGKIIVKEH